MRILTCSRALVLNESFAGFCTILRIDAVPSGVHSTTGDFADASKAYVDESRDACLSRGVAVRESLIGRHPSAVGVDVCRLP